MKAHNAEGRFWIFAGVAMLVWALTWGTTGWAQAPT